MNKKFFERAMVLANRRMGFTSPNPSVGAVIVKGGRVVAEGVHNAAGEPHAEIVAIKSLMDKSGVVYTDLEPALFKNAELYVTLEPCSHNGKTPPCVDAIVAAGFKKVYVGMLDPFKMVNGRGVKKLRAAHVDVEVLKSSDPLALKIRSLNQPFIKWAQEDLPYVVLKAGMSLDGKITSADGGSRWITGELARVDGRLRRSRCDAVFVGANTVKNDDCELVASGKFRRKNLVRCIFGRKLSLPLNRKVFRDSNVIYFVQDLGTKKNQDRYRKAGITIKKVRDGVSGLRQALKFLAGKGIQSVFVEGGSFVHGLFIDASIRYKNIVDEVLLYVAPKIIGGKDSLNVIGGEGALTLSKSISVEDLRFDFIGDDLRVSGIINHY